MSKLPRRVPDPRETGPLKPSTGGNPRKRFLFSFPGNPFLFLFLENDFLFLFETLPLQLLQGIGLYRRSPEEGLRSF